MAVLLLVVVLFAGDKNYLGHWYISIIVFASFFIVTNYIGKLERKNPVDKKVKIISWICFIATAIFGLIFVVSNPEIFNTYGIK